jgi:hypothetical protein
MERFGTPICVCCMTLMIVLVTILKANMRFNVVKGMKFDITKFLPNLILWILVFAGLIFLFLVLIFAIISDETIHAVVTYARIAKGKTPSYSFSDPI